MAKKRPATRSSNSAEKKTPGRTSGGSPRKQIEQSPKVKKAADAVRRAEAELEKARGLYQKVRKEASDRLKAAREKTVGDLIDATLETVRKHPGPGVIVAALMGFFVGRIFRR